MSKNLEKIICDIISLNGPLSIEAYWNLCLSHPEHGYYFTRDPLGAAGDFTTSPEISQLFGEMIGIWVVEQWQRLGSPLKFHLVECGPGRGTLMVDLLRIGKIDPDFIKAANIHLIETSPSLRTKQQDALASYNIKWHNNISDVPVDAPIIIIGNEFLDALPIQQFIMKDGECFERVVGVEGNVLRFGLLHSPHPNFPHQEGSEIFELSVTREIFISDISKQIKIQSGAGVMIDYGYDEPKFGDTFQAVKNHQYADVLKDCGEVDLTSHVDFGRLKNISEQNGLSVNLQSQSDFLKRMGIEARATQLMHKSHSIESGLQRLIDNDKMGQLFRVMEFIA